MEVTGGELVAWTLQKSNISTAFGLVGNHLSPILVHLKNYGIKLVDVRHEQAAILMADGFAQVTRKPAVAMVVGGPGFTNAITGIVKAYMANTPMVIILGAAVPEQKDMGSLQDMEQISMIKPYTKWAATVYTPQRIPEYLNKALEKASSGRMGPVVLEIPINILKAQVDQNAVIWSKYDKVKQNHCISKERIKEITSLIMMAKKPVIIAGDEVYYGKAEKELICFAEKSGIPVFTVNKARGCIPDNHELCFGNGRILEAGFSLYAYKNTDIIINIGVYSDYQMGFYKAPVFPEDTAVVNIVKDVEQNTASGGKQVLTVESDIKEALLGLTEYISDLDPVDYSSWVIELKEESEIFWERIMKQESTNKKVNPVFLIQTIKKVIKKDSIIVLDGSNAMFWGSLLFECNFPGQVIIGPDGTFGPMGCGIPLALAAKQAAPDKDVVLYTGDGSFGFNAIEIDTAIRWNIPVMIVIHNDLAWGFCKTTQQALYGDSNTANVDLEAGNYDKMVVALGGYGELILSEENLENSLDKALHSGKIACLNVMIDETMQAPGALSFHESLKKMK